jgi:hypothetical protein
MSSFKLIISLMPYRINAGTKRWNLRRGVIARTAERPADQKSNSPTKKMEADAKKILFPR